MAVRRASHSGPQFCRDDGDGRGASPAVVAQKSFDDSLVRLHQRCWPKLSTQRALDHDGPARLRTKRKRLTSLWAASVFGAGCRTWTRHPLITSPARFSIISKT